MKRSTKSGGLDVHQATTVTTVREETGRVIARSRERATLKQLARTDRNLVEDSTRVMLRLKTVFRARGSKTVGTAVYQAAQRRIWLGHLSAPGVLFRAETLCAELEVLQELRPKAKAAMLAEAKRDPARPVPHTIPYLGPVRVALLMATLQPPWRVRTKRHLWAYAGLALVTRTSAEYEVDGQHKVMRRRRRFVQTRGLSRNHNRGEGCVHGRCHGCVDAVGRIAAMV
jgi:hypothetical protein